MSASRHMREVMEKEVENYQNDQIINALIALIDARMAINTITGERLIRNLGPYKKWKWVQHHPIADSLELTIIECWKTIRREKITTEAIMRLNIAQRKFISHLANIAGV